RSNPGPQGLQDAEAGDVPTRSVELRDDAAGDGVTPGHKDDRDRPRLPLERKLAACPYALLLAIVNADKEGKYETLRTWLETVVPTSVEEANPEMDPAQSRGRCERSGIHRSHVSNFAP